MINRPTGTGVRGGRIDTKFLFFKSIEDYNASESSNLYYDFTGALVGYVFENTLSGTFNINVTFKTDEVEKYFESSATPVMLVQWQNGTILCGVKRTNGSIDGSTKQEILGLYLQPFHEVYGPVFSRRLISNGLNEAVDETLGYIYNKYNVKSIPKLFKTENSAKIVNVLQNETFESWVRKQTKRCIDPIDNTPIFCWQNVVGYNLYSLKTISEQHNANLVLVGPGQVGDFISEPIEVDSDKIPTFYCLNMQYPLRTDLNLININNKTLYRTYNSYTGEMKSLNDISTDDIMKVVDIPINGLNEMYDNSGFGQALVDSFTRSLETSLVEVDIFVGEIILTPGSVVYLASKPGAPKDKYLVYKTLIESSSDKGQQRLTLLSYKNLSKFVTDNIDTKFAQTKYVKETTDQSK